MAKNDYFVIAYRIMVYLYACLKTGETVNLDYLKYDTDDFPIGKDYWNYIFEHLMRDGYIEGVFIKITPYSFPVLGKIENVLRITPKGIEYLHDNSTIQKAKTFLKELREFIPGMN